MVALTERFQGLRRPGASVLHQNKGLPSRPNENVLARKAVNNSPNIHITTSAPTGPDISTPSQDRKDLPQLPPQPPPLPHIVSPPQPQAQPQAVRPPRGSSLSPRLENPPPVRPANSLQPPQHATPRPAIRPVSEAPSISQFIPDPEPEPEYQQSERPTSISNTSSAPSSNGTFDGNGKQTPESRNSYIPPLPEPTVIPPLTRTHYDCYQSHRLMLISNNVWYATACMTCRKLDQEIRHRCSFCCVRICASCFESLQKCKNRSLKELIATLPEH
ncbi:hypothetical protein BGW36DRAFT_425925 [Talaromyces proteolyticus]|uniref:Uncharacterized protein n=1 Tax=Talaromyces proteolyticus TaxID=1131652 RepID=A0AAD4L091_9EURO|nr:uncharacterized protein BGW36DRAFT_425925 [Talaromyces proteolyticus]KAH8701130.1 hypothetical protein BGW36DRAFT_425925 [Talaromyces proteolyticus]